MASRFSYDQFQTVVIPQLVYCSTSLQDHLVSLRYFCKSESASFLKRRNILLYLVWGTCAPRFCLSVKSREHQNNAPLARRLLFTMSITMARQRKAASKADSEVPLTSPSKTFPRAKPDKPLIDITEDEQWRLINQSGVLQNPALVQESQVESTVDVEDEEIYLCDEIFNAVMLIIPFSSLLLLMDVYVSHNIALQYI